MPSKPDDTPDSLRPYAMSVWRRFWSYVKKGEPDDCWLWLGGTQGGYGLLWIAASHGGKDNNVDAHRIAKAFELGRVVRYEENVCHSCDVRNCVNTRHLFISDRRGNRADCVKKGRQAKGEKINTARLTEEEVKQILKRAKAGEGIASLEKDFGARTTIYSIINRQCWRHVECPE